MVSQARLFAAFALVAIATAVSVDHQVVELGTAVPGITCPAGSLKTTANGNSATCTACDAGKFAAAGATQCCATLDKGLAANPGARSRTDATPCSHLCNECRFYRKGNVPSQLCINWVKRNENKKGMANFVAWTAKTADDAKCGK